MALWFTFNRVHVLLHSCITVEREGLWLWLCHCDCTLSFVPVSSIEDRHYTTNPKKNRIHTYPHPHHCAHSPIIIQRSHKFHWHFINKNECTVNKNECNWIQLKIKQRDINSIAAKTVERIYQSARIYRVQVNRPRKSDSLNL